MKEEKRKVIGEYDKMVKDYRKKFEQYITDYLKEHKKCTLSENTVCKIENYYIDKPVIECLDYNGGYPRVMLQSGEEWDLPALLIETIITICYDMIDRYEKDE